jgi:magnesium-protoporphyrin IX monomethyl ester (oxidative) cyclase
MLRPYNKILLINPPLKSDNPREPIAFPLGLGYLAAMLRRERFQPVILDACLGPVQPAGDGTYHLGLSTEQICLEVLRVRPDVIGVSVPFTSRLPAVKQLGAELRRGFPDLPLVAGGMHATVAPQDLLDAGFDAVILGEAELSFPRYLKNFAAGISPPLEDGLAYRQNGETCIIPQSSHPNDLDDLPFPARDLVPFDQYLRRSGGRWIRFNSRVASVITSRGCPYRCTFCSAFRLTGRKYRRRSAANVLDEISEIVRRYRPSVISFEDDNLTADRARAVEIFEGIARRFPRLKWMTPNGVSIRHLDPELLALMKRSGCRSVNLAFESGDPQVLKEFMKKDLDPEEGRRVRGWCRKAGIPVNGYFVLGMPGETAESMRRTRDFALSLDLDGIGIFIATPFPGTELYDLCLEKGYLVPEYRQGSVQLDCDTEVLHRPLIETPWLKGAELLAFHEEFQRQALEKYFASRPMRRWRRQVTRLLSRAGLRR